MIFYIYFYRRDDLAHQYIYCKRSNIAIFEYFYLYIVDQNADERSLYDADDVCNDVEDHYVRRAESVDGAGEEAHRRHLDVVGHQRAVAFEPHRAHAECGDLFVCDLVAALWALPIAAHGKPQILNFFSNNSLSL